MVTHLQLGRSKILVIDDDPNVLASLRRVLSRRFDLTVFQNPFDAIVAVGTVQPDAIVLDVKMPGLDGIRLLERLRAIETTEHIRAVIYSSHEELRESALQAGAYEFIMKGEVTVLRKSLERLMGLKQA